MRVGFIVEESLGEPTTSGDGDRRELEASIAAVANGVTDRK